MISSTTYIDRKSIKLLSLCCHELMGKIEEKGGKKHLMADDYMLDKVSDKIKMIIGIEKLDGIKILIETNGKLADVLLQEML